MTVKELKAYLEEYPDDMEVCKVVHTPYKEEILYTDEVYIYNRTFEPEITVVAID